MDERHQEARGSTGWRWSFLVQILRRISDLLEVKWRIVRVRLTVVAYDNTVAGQQFLIKNGFHITQVTVFVGINENDVECSGELFNPF